MLLFHALLTGQPHFAKLMKSDQPDMSLMTQIDLLQTGNSVVVLLLLFIKVMHKHENCKNNVENPYSQIMRECDETI